ncbi:MAG: DNA adenine methylase [Bacilli bacterium]|nr:DNA adenine methylase [Bacilli bacterium]
MIKAKPFVKWAGGKRQIIKELMKYVPEDYNCYYEPFIGGGALFFELAPKCAVINDSNSELMNVYNVMCDEDKYSKMCRLLNSYEVKNCEEFYYELRNKDRDKEKFNKLSDYAKAARTIYLNKACFNGLYRVNSKGEFNVPYNKKTKVNTYDKENLLVVHMYLNMNDVKILNTDFEETLKLAKKGDFVYIDPPYDQINSSFTSYTEEGFGKNEQKRLARVYKELDERGVKVMLSNHNTPLINELYKDFNIHIIEAKRNINSKGTGRGKVEEVIVTNY